MKNVLFAGHVSPTELRDRMSVAKLFVHTAIAEGSPTAALEAMACALPIVVTPSNDYSTIIRQGLNGIVTLGWNADELVTSLNYYLRDPVKLERGANAAREIAASHRWDVKARIVTDAIAATIERHKAKTG